MPSSSIHSAPDSPAEPMKRRRITRACDRCHRSGVKCSPSPDPNTCAPCAAFRSDCTYNRPIKRRGPVPRSAIKGERGNPNGSGPSSSVEPGSTRTSLAEPWRYEPVTSPELIEALVDTYHRIVYPIFPYFHWPTFRAHIHAQRYKSDQAFYAVTMSVCAIAAARVRDGAGTMSDAVASPTLPPTCPPSEAFYDASLRAFPTDLSQASEFDYKRAKVLLAMICIQYGQVRQLTTNIGDYMTLCSIDGFHNEGRWPANLPETEVQERRRLFWGAYTIDVYASTTWGMVVRHREAQSTVLYPAEVYDDDEITETGLVPRNRGRASHLVGWNFTTSLYRILEHALNQLRQRRQDPTEPSSRVTELYASRAGPTPRESLDLVAQLYAELPDEFKSVKAMTGNIAEDRYGFQAADIIVTMQTVKMVMMSLEDATVEKRCHVAGELLDALSTVPTAYIQAISSPILHHLAGVGHLLGGVIQSPLSHWSYLQVRNILLAMADLLSSLESTLSFVPGIADRLRDHVLRIDQYMTAAALDRSRRTQVFHNALPPSAWTGGPGAGGQGGQGGPPRVLDRPRDQIVSEDVWSSPNSMTKEVVYPQITDLEFSLPSVPIDAQFTLPNDLIHDWPFDMSEAFDFLGGV